MNERKSFFVLWQARHALRPLLTDVLLLGIAGIVGIFLALAFVEVRSETDATASIAKAIPLSATSSLPLSGTSATTTPLSPSVSYPENLESQNSSGNNVPEENTADLSRASNPLNIFTPLYPSSAQASLPSATTKDTGPRPAQRITERFKIKNGDTLSGVLDRSDLLQEHRQSILATLTKSINPHRIHPGQYIELSWTESINDQGDPQQHIKEVRFLPDVTRVLTFLAKNDLFDTIEHKQPVNVTHHILSGTIQNSLYVDSLNQGLSMGLLSAYIDIFSSDIDFQREIHPGNAYTLFYSNEQRLSDGKSIKGGGDILTAIIETNRDRYTYYRYEDQQGHVDYYNDKGESARRAIVKTPIDGARISSRFGKRRHPILGFTRQHNGVDFAVPTGTPVYSAGQGHVVKAGRYKGFGIYVQVRHPGGYATAYAHLSRLHSSIKKGSAVKQGQVIAYSGNTGLSTGPHLHYEVHRGGRPVNPLTIKLPRVARLEGDEFKRFQQQRDDLIVQQERLLSNYDLANSRQ